MTARECARLQSMGHLQHLPASRTSAFKALGNAVNVTVVAAVANALLTSETQPVATLRQAQLDLTLEHHAA